jgi:hypothetical protein
MRPHSFSLLLLATLLPALVTHADGRLAGIAIAPQGHPPRFEDYRTSTIFTGKPVPPKLTTAGARRFRTAIRTGAAEGPNFAGRYTLVSWGCGTACISLAIVDAATGRVVLPEIILSPAATELEDGFVFRKDSRLLIASGAETTRGYDRLYYLWEKNHLRLIRREHLES